jgi:hypothetical protein
MKSLTYILKLFAIALNAIFLPYVLSLIGSGFGGLPLSLLDWVECILSCALLPVTLITIALSFHKKFKILTSVLRIIAFIVNAYLLVLIILFQHDIFEDIVLEPYSIYSALPALNLVALALTFIKEKQIYAA